MKTQRKAYPGIALTGIALVVIILFGMMGAFLLYISSSGGQSAAGFLNGHKAYYIANAGIEYAMNELQTLKTITNQSIPYGGGTFTITNTPLSDTTFRLISQGTLGKYARNIRLDYYYVNVKPTPFDGAYLAYDLTDWESSGDISNDFDGTNDPVVTDTTSENIIDPGNSEPFTISAWVQVDPIWTDPTNVMVIASMYQDKDKVYALFLEGGTVSGNIVAKVGLRYRDAEFVADDSDVNDGKLHLVTAAAVRDGNKITCNIFVDDTRCMNITEKEPGNPITGNVNHITIGSWYPEGGNYFSGSINSVGIYHDFLTEDEVAEIYYSNPDLFGDAGSIITQILSISEF